MFPNYDTITALAAAARTPEQIAERVRQFADAGLTDLVLDPTVPSLDQVDRLAGIVLQQPVRVRRPRAA